MGQRRVHRRRGDAPLPGVLVEPRRHRHRRLPGGQLPRQPLVHRRPRQPGSSGHRDPLPGSRFEQCQGHPARPRVERWQHRGDLGPRHLSVPRRCALGRQRATAAHRAVARPAFADGARGRPAPRRHQPGRRRRRCGVGGTGARHTGRAGRRATDHGRRPRWGTAPDGGRHTCHTGRPAGAGSDRLARRHCVLHRQPDRRRHGAARVALVRRWHLLSTH
ncbi:unannotated protein [freshwater metagenome]|uniref:Unannotated protein n=1 Tax=freshwater metagenome TaxID=449393 RepID=A0A6J7ASD1_9ZZZZ